MSLLFRKMFPLMNETAEGGEGITTAQTAPSAEEMGGAASDGGADLDFDGINNILSFDPFAEDVGGDTSSGGDEGAQPDGGEGTETEAATGAEETGATSEPGKTETQSQGEQQDEEGAAAEENPELALLRQQLAAQSQIIEQLQKSTSGQEDTAGKGGETSTEDTPKVPAYSFTIPDQLMTLLDSEDPTERRQGIAAMAQGIAQTTHQQVLGQVQGMFTSIVPQTVMNVVQEQNYSKAIFEDFYGTHKDLNREELKPLITQTAETVWKETKAQQWSPKLRDTIAQRVRTILTQGNTSTKGQDGGQDTRKVPPANPNAGRQSRANNAVDSASAVADDVNSLLF